MTYLNNEWFVDNNPLMGYKWSIQNQYGVVYIDENELFMRVEFSHVLWTDSVSLAIRMGWRWNVDNCKWYRIKGY